MTSDISVDLGICTFRRPQLRDILASLAAMDRPDGVRLRVIVADNDTDPSAQALVAQLAADLPFPVHYIHAPARNISIARNACLDAAGAAYFGFVDDDETVVAGWLQAHLETLRETGANATFGPVRSIYPDGTPDWIREQDHHSTIAQPRGGVIETGYAGNVMLQWKDMPWQDARFDLARGRTGGEDTEFFFRLYRMGIKYALSPEAVAYEPVPPERASFKWLLRRKYRVGQSYAASATTHAARARLFASAALKAGYCGLVSALRAFDAGGMRFWALRGAMHAGVCAGCLKLKEPEFYG